MTQARAKVPELPTRSPPEMTLVPGGGGPGAGARLAAVVFPFVVVLAVEAVFRVAGIGAPTMGTDADPWANPLVAFEPGTEFFPEWSEKLAMPKPSGRTRVFVLGGSTSAGFGVDTPFSAVLERSLKEKLDGADIEVVNGGVGAAGSHRVYEVMRRAAQFEPDLFVVYMGHNEFLEDIFFDPDGLAARLEQTSKWARRIHVVNALRGALGEKAELKLTGKKPILKSRFLGTMSFPLIKDDAQVAQKLMFLKGNMLQMVEFAHAHDAGVVFVPAEPSLLTGPSWPEHGPGFERDPDGWNAAYARAKTALRERRYADATTALAAARAIDPDFAMVPYLAGLAALGEGRRDDGVRALREAVRLDKNGDRASSLIAQTILDVAREADVPALSLAERFDAEMPEDFARLVDAGGLEDFLAARKPGHTLFLDHCHPSERGHVIIGDQIATWLVEAGLIGR